MTLSQVIAITTGQCLVVSVVRTIEQAHNPKVESSLRFARDSRKSLPRSLDGIAAFLRWETSVDFIV